jgi:hypothetical protein
VLHFGGPIQHIFGCVGHLGVRRKRKAASDSSPTLESIIGHTVTHASALAVNPVTEEIAYSGKTVSSQAPFYLQHDFSMNLTISAHLHVSLSAGCVAVIYSVAKHRQVRFFRASKGISCLGFSRDGRYLAVGERGKEVRRSSSHFIFHSYALHKPTQ